MPLRTPLVLLLTAAALAGCGRRGGLQEPSAPNAALAPAMSQPAPAPGEGTLPDAQSPGAQEPARASPAAAPRRRFFLDPLI